MIRALGLMIFLSHAAFGQFPKAPEFEVADVKVRKTPSDDGGKIQFLPGGRIEIADVSLKSIIMAAYDVQENMIAGAPGWLDSDRFDIVAKASADTPRGKLRQMLQLLLASRFKLAVHREDKPTPAYAMVVAKDGFKLQQASGGPAQCRWNTPDAGLVERECHNMSLDELAISMPGWGRAGRVDLPVVNLTGIKGAFDFKLRWSMPSTGGDASKTDAPVAADPGSSIFDAMGKLGLKLEQRKLPMPVIVIDHVERMPTSD